MEGTEIPETFVKETGYTKDLETLMANAILEERETSGQAANATEKQKELEKWKRRNHQDKLRELKDRENKIVMEITRTQEDCKRTLSGINEQNDLLRREIQALKAKCEAKNAKCGEFAQSFQLKRDIPEKKMKCTHLENIENEDDCMNISCLFHITPKIPFRLNQGEALITFEQESVAQELIKKHSHTVQMENEKIRLQALPVTLETGVVFELHSKISQRNLHVSNIPDLNIPEEWMRDKLELHFCQTKLGGGVQKVAYDSRSQMALITFAEPLDANDIAWFGPYSFHTSGWTLSFLVSPVTQSHLEQFQIFSGISKKTILLTGIKVEGEDEESVEDLIVIHFQKASNGGGEVESIKYASKGNQIAYFENYADDVI
ncbi:N-myc-interactor isoform X2 [Sceloporus undulatus]|uniref:N-myc-interactor isoform X2 n=1 Tax=Sceloporus undulatus TaxID=8520 RepID=UPI001C4CB912|nr:N-myc-interactor isoform X2 [Sceloporus undulatus]